jgi:hypothetical protein
MNMVGSSEQSMQACCVIVLLSARRDTNMYTWVAYNNPTVSGIRGYYEKPKGQWLSEPDVKVEIRHGSN